jgi:hypothetical protein
MELSESWPARSTKPQHPNAASRSRETFDASPALGDTSEHLPLRDSVVGSAPRRTLNNGHGCEGSSPERGEDVGHFGASRVLGLNVDEAHRAVLVHNEDGRPGQLDRALRVDLGQVEP